MLASVADVIHEATDGLEYGWLFCNGSKIKTTVRAPSSPPTKASSSDSFIYLLTRTAEHPGAPALATLERPFRAITYLFAAELAPGAERSERITRTVHAPRSSRSEDSLVERGHGKENNNRPFIYNLYARQIDS